MKITAEVKPIFDYDKQTLKFLTKEKSDTEKCFNRMYEELIDFKEETIKKALIKLGWTPPKKIEEIL